MERKRTITTALVTAAFFGCGGASGPTSNNPYHPSNGDTPNTTDPCLNALPARPSSSQLMKCMPQAEALCQDRSSAVLRTDQPAFTPNAIRWSCSDVAGVNNNNNDDRGQEYCEYFAM